MHQQIKGKQFQLALNTYHQLAQADKSFLDVNVLYKTFYFSDSQSTFLYEKGGRDKDLRAYKHFIKLLLKESPDDLNLLLHLAGISYDFM